jgi:hypothetical protein
MKSKGPKFSALSAAMGALGGNSANQSQQVGMNAVTAGPLDRMRGMFGQSKQPTVSSTGQNIFGQSKQPTTGAMGAMDQANSQSLMGQDKIGCSDGMMAKSPLKSSAGAYENPTIPEASVDSSIATAISDVATDLSKTISNKSATENEDENKDENKDKKLT